MKPRKQKIDLAHLGGLLELLDDAGEGVAAFRRVGDLEAGKVEQIVLVVQHFTPLNQNHTFVVRLARARPVAMLGPVSSQCFASGLPTIVARLVCAHPGRRQS